MACLGVHFAIKEHLMEKLLQCSSDAQLDALIQSEMEEKWDTEWLYQTDKAWDAIHRSLTDGELAYDNGQFPFNAVILGGRQLYGGDEYIVSLVSPEQVKIIAELLQLITKQIFREKYFNINQEDYELNDNDFDYTWHWFKGLPSFFAEAAKDGRAVIFTADQ